MRPAVDLRGRQTEPNFLEAACAMFLAYYNFVWRTRLPEEGRLRLPAAMAAGVVDTLWTLEDFFDRVMGVGTR